MPVDVAFKSPIVCSGRHDVRYSVVYTTPNCTHRDLLAQTLDSLISVERLDSKDALNLDALKRPELGITFTKLHAWALSEYEKYASLIS